MVIYYCIRYGKITRYNKGKNNVCELITQGGRIESRRNYSVFVLLPSRLQINYAYIFEQVKFFSI